jgi:hypothetical protein
VDTTAGDAAATPADSAKAATALMNLTETITKFLAFEAPLAVQTQTTAPSLRLEPDLELHVGLIERFSRQT